MSLLVTPEELSRELAAAEPPLLIDLRPVENYCENHLPGAVHLDLFGISSIDTDPAPLKAFFWIIEHLLASRGVSNDVPVVVYDDTSGIRAARAFWFLEYFGHPNIRVLDGGYNAWIRKGLPLTQHAPKPAPSGWTGRRDAAILAGWRDVTDRLNSPDAVILDTRSDGEYCGTTVRAARGGAMPGAVHLEWTNNLAPDGTFKSPDELRAMYSSRGRDARSGSRHLLPGRVSRRALVSCAAPDRLSASPQLHRIVERVGRSRRSAHRAPQGTVNGQHRQGR